jgi:transcription elongation factor Elf1
MKLIIDIAEPLEPKEVQEAIEKQVGKKPRYTTIFEGEKAEKLKQKKLPNYEIYKCPICNYSVAERTFVTSLYPDGFIKDNYCSNCGQKLDWSEADEN